MVSNVHLCAWTFENFEYVINKIIQSTFMGKWSKFKPAFETKSSNLRFIFGTNRLFLSEKMSLHATEIKIGIQYMYCHLPFSMEHNLFLLKKSTANFFWRSLHSQMDIDVRIFCSLQKYVFKSNIVPDTTYLQSGWTGYLS